MKECCREYERILNVLKDVMTRTRPTDRDRLVMVRKFIRENWDAHVDQAGEASWVNK